MPSEPPTRSPMTSQRLASTLIRRTMSSSASSSAPQQAPKVLNSTLLESRDAKWLELRSVFSLFLPSLDPCP